MGELAVVVEVQLLEGLKELVLLLLDVEEGDDVQEDGLLQLEAGTEPHQVLEHLAGVHRGVVESLLADPVVAEGLLSRDTLGRVVGEHAGDQVLGRLRNLAPIFLSVDELAFQDSLEDDLVIGPVEGRVPAQQDV